MAPLHDRMPVVIAPKDYDLWLDAAVQEPERLHPLLRPYPDAEMEAYPVSTLVNSPKNNSPGCVKPDNGVPSDSAQGQLRSESTSRAGASNRREFA